MTFPEQQPHPLDPSGQVFQAIQRLHRQIRAELWQTCQKSSVAELSAVADDAEGDTIYAIDRVSEQLLVTAFAELAANVGGIVLVAEGVESGKLVLPLGSKQEQARLLIIVDPIDGTRGLMYQKRSAWILTGVAANRGAETSLSDIQLAFQTEVPLVKQYLADELWAMRGRGAQAQRVNLLTLETRPLLLQPSRADHLEHGYAMLSRFFPGARDELAAIDDEVMLAVLGPQKPGKALCFEDQYTSTGGQLYELMVGHDRFNADLRPLLGPLLASRGQVAGICCHPYDLCALLVAEEAGVVLSCADGAPLNAPLNVEANVAWVGYANQKLRARIEPTLQSSLRRRGLL